MEGKTIQPLDQILLYGLCRISIHSSRPEITTDVHLAPVPYADLASNLSEKLSDMRTIRCIAGFLAHRPGSLFTARQQNSPFFIQIDSVTLSSFYRPQKGFTPPRKVK